jgi:hypothetical protein
LDRARRQAPSAAGRWDRARRQVLSEGSFADAANHHGFKRSRWRRLWRQQIQDPMIAAIQNIRILIRRGGAKLKAAAAQTEILQHWMQNAVADLLSQQFELLRPVRAALNTKSGSKTDSNQTT